MEKILTIGIILSYLIIAIQVPSLCQSNIDYNFEFQAYPTGLIPGIRLEKKFSNGKAAHIRLGYNWIRHRDLGVHNDERGHGFGFTLGYKKYFKPIHQGWSLGVRNDFWWNSIDWEDQEVGGALNGNTKITVLQPTLELSYLFDNQNYIISPSISFGYEWNIRTKGEATGEGAILLVGIQVGKRFK